jgi:hypothetical protein
VWQHLKSYCSKAKKEQQPRKHQQHQQQPQSVPEAMSLSQSSAAFRMISEVLSRTDQAASELAEANELAAANESTAECELNTGACTLNSQEPALWEGDDTFMAQDSQRSDREYIEALDPQQIFEQQEQDEIVLAQDGHISAAMVAEVHHELNDVQNLARRLLDAIVLFEQGDAYYRDLQHRDSLTEVLRGLKRMLLQVSLSVSFPTYRSNISVSYCGCCAIRCLIADANASVTSKCNIKISHDSVCPN